MLNVSKSDSRSREQIHVRSMCRIARASSKSKAAEVAAERTTATAVVNIVKGKTITQHYEFLVKAKKSQKEMIARLYAMNVEWGNLNKAPTLSKEPLAIKIDDSTVTYVAVITHRDSQCSMCGTWDESDYCPLCKGDVVDESSIAADL